MRQFKRTYIEITNVCNLSCDFCPQSKRKPEFMKLEVFEGILKQIQGYSKHLYLHIKGEPLLHPELDSFLDLCAQYGFVVNLTTNGTLLKRMEERIITKTALRQVNISLHSFDANVGSETIEKYLQDIFDFSKTALKLGRPFISLRLWNLGESKEGAFQIENSEVKKNRHILEKIEEAYSLPYKIEEKLNVERGIQVAPIVFLNQGSKFEWPDIKLEEITAQGFCYGLRDQIGILVDGTVVPCCLDGEGVVDLGNIKEQSFEAIIEGPRARTLYNGFTQRELKEELCRKCDYRRRFTK